MPSGPDRPDRPQKKASPLGAAISGGIELAVAVLLGFWMGKQADEKLGTGPWLLLLGVFAGFGVGLYLLIGSAKQTPRGG